MTDDTHKPYRGWFLDGEADDGSYKVIDAPLYDSLPAGYYSYNLPYIIAQPLTEQADIKLSEQQREIHDRISTFWDSKEQYRRMSIPQRRGILLHGKPGTGKTTVARVAARDLIARGGIVLELNPRLLNETPLAVKEVKRVEGDRPVMLIVEDIDSYSRDGVENWFTNFLDGVVAHDGLLVLATTNYVDKISDRLSRQGRIDDKWEIPAPTTEQRAVYIETLLREIDGADEDFMARMVLETDGMVMSDVKGYVVNQVVFERTPKLAASR